MVQVRNALISAVVALVLAVPAVLAYDSEVGAVVDVSGPGTSVCPAQGLTYTATVKDTNGNVLSGVTVHWSTGATGTTNAQGQTSITVTVSASTNITASVDGASGSIAVTCITGAVEGTVGLPRTDTAAPGGGGSIWLLAVAALVVAVPTSLRYRRRRR